MIPQIKNIDMSMSKISDDKWNDFLDVYKSQATVFHTQAWMKTLQQAFGYKPKCLIDEKFTAALPYMVDTRYGIDNYFSMPYDTYGGVIGDSTHRKILFDTFAALPGIGVRYYVDKDQMYHSYGNSKFNSIIQLTELMDISQCEDISDLHKDTRTAIRSAINHDVDASYDRFYIKGRFDKVPEPLVESIIENMVPNGYCAQFVARIGSTRVASSLFFIYGDTAMYWANTTTKLGRKTNANHLLMWQAIRYARSKGCTTLNLGASPPGATGLVKFKKSWGSETHVYYKQELVPSLMRLLLAIKGLINRG